MKYLNTLLENSPIDESIKQEVIKSYKEVKEKLGKLNLAMDDDAQFVFSNHILALLKRMKGNAFVEDIDEETMKEVSPQAFELAEGLVHDLFTERGLKIHKSEVFLVATHMEMALEKQKEEEK